MVLSDVFELSALVASRVHDKLRRLESRVAVAKALYARGTAVRGNWAPENGVDFFLGHSTTHRPKARARHHADGTLPSLRGAPNGKRAECRHPQNEQVATRASLEKCAEQFPGACFVRRARRRRGLDV